MAATSSVRVKNIDWRVGEDELKALMERAGRVEQCQYLYYEDSRKFKGQALVTYATEAEARRALTELDGCLLRSRHLAVVARSAAAVIKYHFDMACRTVAHMPDAELVTLPERDRMLAYASLLFSPRRPIVVK